MKNRNALVVLLFGILTSGIYSWYWIVKTKGEMNKMGEKIPTAWIWLIPFVGNIWWYWKYSEGVDHVTQKEIPTILALLALSFLGPIGQAIIQESFNRIEIPVTTISTPIVLQQESPVLPQQPIMPPASA